MDIHTINTIELVILSQSGLFTLPDIQEHLAGQDNKHIVRTLYRLEDAGAVEKTDETRAGRSLYQLSKEGRVLAEKLNKAKKRPIKPKSKLNDLNETGYLEFCEQIGHIQEIINTIERDEYMAAWWRYCQARAGLPGLKLSK